MISSKLSLIFPSRIHVCVLEKNIKNLKKVPKNRSFSYFGMTTEKKSLVIITDKIDETYYFDQCTLKNGELYLLKHIKERKIRILAL